MPVVIETEEENERMLAVIEKIRQARISKTQARALANYFHVPADLFI